MAEARIEDCQFDPMTEEQFDALWAVGTPVDVLFQGNHLDGK